MPVTTRAAAEFITTTSRRGPGSPSKSLPNHCRVLLWRAPCQSLLGCLRQAEVCGPKDKPTDGPIAHFSNLRFSCQRNFVQTAAAMHDEGAINAEFHERSGYEIEHLRGVNAQDLRVSPGGIRKWTQQIENRALSDLFARCPRMPRGCVGHRREQKPDAQLANGAARLP